MMTTEIAKGESIIVEIRAGTGGEEASLFANDLFRMYSKYAKSQNWKQRILDSRFTELGGIKEIIFELEGENVFSKMKFEAGVHRVQRIPVTEKRGRIHTSTATVAVLPKPSVGQIKIDPKELKIETFRASGPGGQYMQKTETAVRITHLPTRIVVSSQAQRSQLQNKENALKILQAKLLEKKEMEEFEKIHGKRKAQIKWAKRAEKIRTYNFPQNRVTDHRIKKSWYNLENILDGNLEPVIQALSRISQ
jgi:peptide chain release factor 1